jgi:NADPH-dependent 2,4-dienoyl-CoA reductase/sulfur reductase-like enzyme
MSWAEDARRADVVVYGGTPGGIAAAVAAARQGRRVLLCEYEDHIGGIVSNGLTNADIGKRQAVGGLFYEYTRRVVRHYQEQD